MGLFLVKQNFMTVRQCAMLWGI